MKLLFVLTFILSITLLPSRAEESLEGQFASPSAEARPWVFWHWTNGNVTREGITKDLEAMRDVGIGGVITFRLSGPAWAPPGPLKTGMENQLPMIRYAAEEADRLGLHFSLVIDYGYGSGGPHITPELSMQRLYQSETTVQGGRMVRVKLPKPSLKETMNMELKKAWLRPGASIKPEVLNDIKNVDSYKDIAVFAVPASSKASIKKLDSFTGLDVKTAPPEFESGRDALPGGACIDLSAAVNEDGELYWQAPPGNWTVIRLGYGSNFKLTRPSPAPELGLEADRIHPRGLDRHFDHRLKPVLEALNKDGTLIDSIFIDSWEAGSQNWTLNFAETFKELRGYELQPWLPALTGRVVESADKTERFLWDFRQTISEQMLTHYIDRLEARLEPYGIESFYEPYGHMCADPLVWAGRGTFPVAEFWSAPFRKLPKNPGDPAEMADYCYLTMKAMASAANTYDKPKVGAEAFTGARGWSDHPYLTKGIGDHAFTEGINHFIFHLSAHQPYDNVRPGLTHRHWGQHYNRHQTWWEFTRPYMSYLARCHTLLQQGNRVVDLACLMNEGAPFDFKRYNFPSKLPDSFDLDFCSSEIIQRMSVQDGRIVLPNGVSYRFLEVVPQRLTLPTARKIEALRKAGATIYTRQPILGPSSLVGYPESDQEMKGLTKNWPQLPASGWGPIIAKHNYPPNFEGGPIRWVHRQTPTADIYFVANTEYKAVSQSCVFRVSGKIPELWDAETGHRYPVAYEQLDDGRTRIQIDFEPARSWFVVFRDESTATPGNPFAQFQKIKELDLPWDVRFDPDWGSDQAFRFTSLEDWSKASDPLVKYYSGTASYQTSFKLDQLPGEPIYIDLGRVEVVASVRLNGKDLGVSWKPPHRFATGDALKAGENILEVKIANTWVNRLVGDEQLPLDSKWKDPTTLLEWPKWFPNMEKRPSGRYTFTTARHYNKKSKLQPSGLLGPVRLVTEKK